MEQMGLMMHSFNAARPTELALQEEIRQLKADAKSQATQHFQTRATLASTSQALASCRAELRETSLANGALKRGCMVRDLRAMATDYMQEQAMTGYAGYQQRSSELIEEVTALHNTMVEDGIAQEVLTPAASVHLFSTVADSVWLQEQMTTSDQPYNVWS